MTTWERLTPTGSGTHILTSAGDTIDSGTIANKQHLKFEIYAIADGTVAPSFRFNSDAGTNYTRRREHNGSSDGTNINQNELNSNGASTNAYVSGDIINIAAKEKFLIAEYVIQKTGAGQAPDRMSLTGKWANTSDAITSIQVYNSDNGSFDTGSTLTVWGADDQGTTAKDKSSITDVPIGTRYEETDTRKIYRWVEGAVAEAKTNVFQGSNSDASNNENYGNSLYVLDTANAGKKISKIGLKIKPQSGSGTGAGNIKCALFDLGSTSGNSRRPTNKLGGKQSAVSGSADPTASYSATLDGYTYATFLENSQPTIPADGKFFLFYVPDRTLTHYTTSTTSSASESIHHSPDYSEDGGANFSYSVDPIPTPFTTDHYGAGGSLGSVMAYTVVEDTWVEKGTAS